MARTYSTFCLCPRKKIKALDDAYDAGHYTYILRLAIAHAIITIILFNRNSSDLYVHSLFISNDGNPASVSDTF